MERSFKQEVELLKLGEGETFHGEGILAVTKALLQSGVAYVGGYQGAPVSHMMDVLNDARDIMDQLGVHIETNASEAGAAAMLGASINYPLRGAVTFKSTVGTNVASDALSNLASAGVTGGALIVLGGGLWRGFLHHPGAQPRLCHEVADVAARSAAEPAENRRDGGAGFPALGSLEHAGIAGVADSSLPRAWLVRDEEEFEFKTLKK